MGTSFEINSVIRIGYGYKRGSTMPEQASAVAVSRS